MTELKKYVKAFNLGEANELEENGYRLHTYWAEGAEECFIMSRQDPSKYDDVERFKKMPIDHAETQVPEGWRIIHHTSKEMILVSP